MLTEAFGVNRSLLRRVFVRLASGHNPGSERIVEGVHASLESRPVEVEALS